MASYLPLTDGGLNEWAANFLQKISLVADPGTIGLTAENVVAYSAAQAAYASAYAAAIAPATRGLATVLAKNEAKTPLVALSRELAMAVTNHPGVTNAQRQSFGLTVRDLQPTPVPPPSSAPTIEVVSVSGFTVKLRLRNGETTGRAKPDGVIGATLFSHVGDTPPTTISDWTFEGNVSRTTVKLVMPNTTASGSRVWITAFWFNRKSQSGPATTPVSTILQGGAVTQTGQLKIAA